MGIKENEKVPHNKREGEKEWAIICERSRKKEKNMQIKKMWKMVKEYVKVVGILNVKKSKRVMLLYKNKLKLNGI